MTGPAARAPDPVALDAGSIRPATRPPEAEGRRRDQVRLLVATPDGIRHRRFRGLPAALRPGDLLVVNTSATLPAAVDGRRRDGRPVVVHVAGRTPSGRWRVEVRRPDQTGPVRDLRRGETIATPDGSRLRLVAGASARGDRPSGRLWEVENPAARSMRRLLAAHGRPITYAYLEGRWPLSWYQPVFARHPGSAEMASAGRPFTHRLVTDLVVRGIRLAPVTLHAGVSSLEDGEDPPAERYRVPPATAALVTATRRAGGRVVAVGTTVTRALETVVAADGDVVAGHGWTDLVLGPARPARVVDGLVTGWHAPGASHLRLLEAVAGRALVRRAYDAAVAGGYRWHEFGDSALFLPSTTGAADRRIPWRDPDEDTAACP